MNSLMKQIALGLVLAVVWGLPAPAQSTNGLLDSFETSADLSRFARRDCLVSSSTNGVTDGQKSGLVIFQDVTWPNIYFQSGIGFTNGDWRAWGGIAVDILNTNSQAVTVDIRVDDDFSADGVHHCQTGSIGVPAAQALSVVMPFTNYVPSGMRGGPPVLFGAANMSVDRLGHRFLAYRRVSDLSEPTRPASGSVHRPHSACASACCDQPGRPLRTIHWRRFPAGRSTRTPIFRSRRSTNCNGWRTNPSPILSRHLRESGQWTATQRYGLLPDGVCDQWRGSQSKLCSGQPGPLVARCSIGKALLFRRRGRDRLRTSHGSGGTRESLYPGCPPQATRWRSSLSLAPHAPRTSMG